MRHFQSLIFVYQALQIAFNTMLLHRILIGFVYEEVLRVPLAQGGKERQNPINSVGAGGVHRVCFFDLGANVWAGLTGERLTLPTAARAEQSEQNQAVIHCGRATLLMTKSRGGLLEPSAII